MHYTPQPVLQNVLPGYDAHLLTSNMQVNDFGFLVCIHPDAYIEKACCPPSSIVECVCGGRDAIVCPADNCTGIQSYEVDDILRLLTEEVV